MKKPDSIFTKRQVEIIKLVALGLTSKEISKKLGISYKTVEVHRYNILRITGEKNTITLLNKYKSINVAKKPY